MGCISAIGNNISENRESLLQARGGIRINPLIDYKRNTLYTGDVKISSDILLAFNQIESTIPYSRTTLLGITALKEAWGNREIQSDIRTGFINGTTVGGMDISEEFYRNFKNEIPSDPELLLQHDCGTVTNFIAKEIGQFDHVSTISTACSSAANTIIHGKQLIDHGYLDRVIVGGTDALSLFTISGFDALQILDHNLCKPFDHKRNGLNLGEGAAYLVLESEESMKKSKAKAIAIFNGGANQNDAYHQTATSPEAVGATLSMKKALDVSRISPDDIDYINVHGTGTSNNDLTESIALKNIFQEIPSFSSTKSFTGHTLATCGALEAIYSIFALNHGLIPANLRFQNEIDETALVPNTKTKQDDSIKSVLSNSFGFGGNNSTLIFSRI
jgi:3-oxoacyl-[acyl-carrier-protein] synthase-1